MEATRHRYRTTWPRPWSPMELDSDSPPPAIYCVRFAALLMNIQDYDTDAPATSWDIDNPTLDGTHTKLTRRNAPTQPRQHSSIPIYHPPRAIPNFPTTQAPDSRTTADTQTTNHSPTMQQMPQTLPLPPVPLPTTLPGPPPRPPQPTLPPVMPATTTTSQTTAPTKEPLTHITISTYNVVSARRERLLEALCAMAAGPGCPFEYPGKMPTPYGAFSHCSPVPYIFFYSTDGGFFRLAVVFSPRTPGTLVYIDIS